MPSMPHPVYRLFLCCFVLTLSACSAIPFSSFGKLKQLEAENFVKLEPGDLMAHLEVPPAFLLDANDFGLGISINDGSPYVLSMTAIGLDQLGTIQRPAAWDNTQQEYLFKLDEAGIQSMRQLQQQMVQQKVDNVRVDINFSPLSWPEESDGMRMSVDLHLAPSQGFFRFLDEAKIPKEFLEEIAAEIARERAEANQ